MELEPSVGASILGSLDYMWVAATEEAQLYTKLIDLNVQRQHVSVQIKGYSPVHIYVYLYSICVDIH